MQYKYRKKAGALNEAVAAPPPAPRQMQNASQTMLQSEDFDDYVRAHDTGVFNLPVGEPTGHAQTRHRSFSRGGGGGAEALGDAERDSGLDTSAMYGGRHGMFYYTVEEGQRVLMIKADGSMHVISEPGRVWAWGRKFRPMAHHIAHPGEFLMVRFRDGRQDHLSGPCDVWLDPRIHLKIEKEDSLQLADKEAIVVYSRGESGEVERRIVSGPASFTPKSGEWLHTFSWHGSSGGSGYRKVPNSLIFQKLWLMPDQMYHDVADVRTADDAVLTIRLMIFFELIDIEKMLETSHDPIGDFVNATTSDVVDFTGRLDFSEFKRNTDRLNQIETYAQLAERAEQCGYRINKVVYRGYGAPPALQQMQDQAIESRTRLQLEKETERQAQDLQDSKLERELTRAEKQREERSRTQTHQLTLDAERGQAQIAGEQQRLEFRLESQHRESEQQQTLSQQRDAQLQAHLSALGELGVDLTAFLTQGRADQVIELRGEGSAPHLHLPGHDAS